MCEFASRGKAGHAWCVSIHSTLHFFHMYVQRPQSEIPHLRKCPYKEGVGTTQNQMPLHVVGCPLPHELLVILMTFLLTLWAVLSPDVLCKGSTANLDQCLDDITPPKLRTPLHLLVQHVSQPICHIAMGPCLLDSIQVIVGEAKLSSQFTPFGRLWGKCIHQHSERHGGS